MESHHWDPQAALVCPYDPLHVVSAKRFQRHIIKCRKNHPDLDFVACPYDARHMLHRSALKQHIAQCPERKPLDADIKQEKDDETGETYRLKGNTSLPTSRYRREIYDDEEDWEPEIQENIARKEEQQQRILRESKPRLREPHFSFDENVVACNRSSRKLPEPGLLSSNRIDGYCSDESETSISSKCSSLYVEPIKNNPRDKITNGNLVNGTLPPRPAGRGMLALLHSTNVDRPTGRGSAHVMLKESIRKPFGIGRGSVKQAAIKTS